MTFQLFIGDYTYSSWSLLGWLLFDRFGLPVETRKVEFAAAAVADQLSEVPPARTVPTLVAPDGTVVWDTLAIAEELACRHPEAGLWPADPALRGMARSLAAEMHSGFSALRGECPMHLQAAYAGFTPSDDTRADVMRIEALWAYARDRSGGPWLAGDYSVADAFFAPVAARFATYGLATGGAAQAYVTAHLADPSFRRWRAMGAARGAVLPWYQRDFPRTAWPGPAPRPARAVEHGPSENAHCPYSGRPVTHFLETGGRIFGVCNRFCRDKTVADPEAWPAFMRLLDPAGRGAR